MINNIIFDFDGVLVDSEMLVAKSFSRYMNNLGYDFQEQNFAILLLFNYPFIRGCTHLYIPIQDNTWDKPICVVIGSGTIGWQRTRTQNYNF